MAITDDASLSEVSEMELVVARRWARIVATLIDEDNEDIGIILACIADMLVEA